MKGIIYRTVANIDNVELENILNTSVGEILLDTVCKLQDENEILVSYIKDLKNIKDDICQIKD